MDVCLSRLLPALAACLGALALRAAEPAAANGTGQKNIVFFGDSLTAGYGLPDPASEAYPALVQKKIDAGHLAYHVVNAGLSGETTAAGVRRVDWILRQPVSIFVLALGGNDGLRGITPEVSRANLQTILERVRAKYPAAKLVVAGMQMPANMGPDYNRAFQEIFSSVAKQNDAVLMPFLLADVGGVTRLNQNDAIHPNEEGAAIVAENVWKVLRPLL